MKYGVIIACLFTHLSFKKIFSINFSDNFSGFCMVRARVICCGFLLLIPPLVEQQKRNNNYDHHHHHLITSHRGSKILICEIKLMTFFLQIWTRSSSGSGSSGCLSIIIGKNVCPYLIIIFSKSVIYLALIKLILISQLA